MCEGCAKIELDRDDAQRRERAELPCAVQEPAWPWMPVIGRSSDEQRKSTTFVARLPSQTLHVFSAPTPRLSSKLFPTAWRVKAGVWCLWQDNHSKEYNWFTLDRTPQSPGPPLLHTYAYVHTHTRAHKTACWLMLSIDHTLVQPPL